MGRIPLGYLTFLMNATGIWEEPMRLLPNSTPCVREGVAARIGRGAKTYQNSLCNV